ncbi:class I SAM-dependent methyltransferase [Hyphomicrobium sp.]|uniref:class I SAM-dependent methyltransferase n=1 Tax=Hyphomicrobium sp. TaxID=82 RepID=UPI002D76E9AD|nr:50S ribosomal protein L11 methyltransferase [Hyphomicrobium sp.]HET6388981.1 50S ribosomal protein L11 methyltransferase [Hyphomicrobium sp.]
MTARLDPADPASAERFILENTKPIAPPLVAEITLRLAEESLPIWQKTEEELGELNVPPPFWAFAWAGGQAVSRYLLDNPEICRGRNVLDIGAGSGLSAIAAAKTGAAHVLAVDIDGLAVAACAINAKANGVAIETTAADLLSTEPPADSVIIVGDLFYERELAERVTRYIGRAKERGCSIFIGDPRRSYFPQDRFTPLAEYQVPVTRELEDYDIKRTTVWGA